MSSKLVNFPMPNFVEIGYGVLKFLLTDKQTDRQGYSIRQSK